MTPGISQGRDRYDVVGASEGPDIGTIAPDAQTFVLRALAAHLDGLQAVLVANSQKADEQVEFEIDASVIPTGGVTYHLPSGAAIVSYHVENLSGSRLLIFAGGSPAGRAINAIAGGYYKVALAPQQVTSMCITAATVTTGIVRVVLTTSVLSPVQGAAS